MNSAMSVSSPRPSRCSLNVDTLVIRACGKVCLQLSRNEDVILDSHGKPVDPSNGLKNYE
jgi:hypothetical protein